MLDTNSRDFMADMQLNMTCRVVSCDQDTEDASSAVMRAHCVCAAANMIISMHAAAGYKYMQYIARLAKQCSQT